MFMYNTIIYLPLECRKYRFFSRLASYICILCILIFVYIVYLYLYALHTYICIHDFMIETFFNVGKANDISKTILIQGWWGLLKIL